MIWPYVNALLPPPHTHTHIPPQDDRTAEKRFNVVSRRWQAGINRAPDKNLLKGACAAGGGGGPEQTEWGRRVSE